MLYYMYYKVYYILQIYIYIYIYVYVEYIYLRYLGISCLGKYCFWRFQLSNWLLYKSRPGLYIAQNTIAHMLWYTDKNVLILSVLAPLIFFTLSSFVFVVLWKHKETDPARLCAYFLVSTYVFSKHVVSKTYMILCFF